MPFFRNALGRTILNEITDSFWLRRLHSCCEVPLGFIFTALQLMHMDLWVSLRVQCTSSYAIVCCKFRRCYFSWIEHWKCAIITMCLGLSVSPNILFWTSWRQRRYWRIGSALSLGAGYLDNRCTNCNLAYTTRQGSRVSCLAQTGFAAFGKGLQLISGSPYAETEQRSRLTLPPCVFGMVRSGGWCCLVLCVWRRDAP